jgi:23S rRNA (cytidine1920-2'-O)/16S rRNA (cytidine1409-2'-O)-methyltransferase
MLKQRLDHLLVSRGVVPTRSQAESYIRLGKVIVSGKVIKKPGYFCDENLEIKLDQDNQYVSRAGLKLESVVSKLNLDFRDKIVLDVGSSTGGFTDFSLKNCARKVYAVDVGTNQLHERLRSDARVEIHEKTDIRVFIPDITPDIILADVSFISLREIIPHLVGISGENTKFVLMLKPQFEAGKAQINKGVVKNNTIRRKILHDFEAWSRQYLIILDKHDSEVPGEKGNLERFYLAKK